jgi:hypothetical protein
MLIIGAVVYHCENDIALLHQLAETRRWSCAKTLQVVARSHCAVVEDKRLLMLRQVLLDILCHRFTHGSKAILSTKTSAIKLPLILGNALGATYPANLQVLGSHCSGSCTVETS